MISASSFYLFLVAMRRAWPPFVVCSVPVRERKSHPMLYWAIVFAVLALAAGILGFVGLSGTLALIAKILLFVFLVLFVLSLIFGRRRGPAV
jgi:uncharacterized membrane protein YtjA (UPF0391 family)